MIVVTVGTQLPFDRLIKMVDELAPSIPVKIFAQTGRGTYVPRNIEWSATIPAGEFDGLLRQASVIMAHAGIGTVLKAYKYRKPIILVPRQASFGEHRNDHQLATVSKLQHRAGIYVARSAEELSSLLNKELMPAIAGDSASQGRQRLQDFIRGAIREATGEQLERSYE